LTIPSLGIIIPNMGIYKTTFREALFSETQQVLLALFYLHPEKSFYTNEIIRLAHKGTGTVHRELVKLTACGILNLETLGNQKRYSANPDHPYYSELKSIIIKTFGLADVLQHALDPILPKIQIAFIYGSVAKNTDTVSSDIDLMIISDELDYADVFSPIEMAEKQMGRPINPTCYSTGDWTKKIKSSNNFILQVKMSPKIFLIGTENELNQLGEPG